MTHDEERAALQRNLKAYIERNNWPVRKFVNSCLDRRIAERTVRRALHGTHRSNDGTLKIFAEILSVTVDDLLAPVPPNVGNSRVIADRCRDTSTTYDDFQWTPLGDLSARVLSDDDFREFLAIDASAYGLASYDNSFLKNWRQAYRNGCIGLFDGGRLVGGIGVWPIDREMTSRLSKGDIANESEVHVSSPSKGHPIGNWYFGGMLLAAPYRAKGYLAPLIDLCLETWSEACRPDIAEPLDMAAILVHPRLHAKIDRWGFVRLPALFAQRFPIVTKRFSSVYEFRLWLNACVLPDLFFRPTTVKPGASKT